MKVVYEPSQAKIKKGTSPQDVKSVSVMYGLAVTKSFIPVQ
jgi:hypothetical protein